MASSDKDIVWMAGEIKRPPFTEQSQDEAGKLLRRLQQGESLSMPFSRPMPSVGSGCHELRVRDERHNWRIMYYVDADAVVILWVFAKKTEQTPADVIANCKRLLREYKGA